MLQLTTFFMEYNTYFFILLHVILTHSLHILIIIRRSHFAIYVTLLLRYYGNVQNLTMNSNYYILKDL